MPSPGPGGSQSSLAGMVVSWLTSQFRTGRSSRKLAMRLDGKREPDYHVERADAAAAWRRHFQTAAFLLERGIVPAVLERLSDIDPSRRRQGCLSSGTRPVLAARRRGRRDAQGARGSRDRPGRLHPPSQRAGSGPLGESSNVALASESIANG